MIALLALGVAIGTMLTATPVSGHVGGTVSHLWKKHIKPKADKRYYTKAKADARFVSGYEVVTVSTASNSDATKSTSADCPEGKIAIGGGARIFGAINETALTTSGPEGPVAAPDRWLGVAREVGAGTTNNWGLRVDVFCVNGPTA